MRPPRVRLHVGSPGLGRWTYTVTQEGHTPEPRIVAWGTVRSWADAMRSGLAVRNVYERFPL